MTEMCGVHPLKGEHPGLPVALLARFCPRIWENHRVTLVEIIRRGLTPKTALAIVTDRPASNTTEADALKQLDAVIADWTANRHTKSWGRKILPDRTWEPTKRRK